MFPSLHKPNDSHPLNKKGRNLNPLTTFADNTFNNVILMKRKNVEDIMSNALQGYTGKKWGQRLQA